MRRIRITTAIIVAEALVAGCGGIGRSRSVRSEVVHNGGGCRIRRSPPIRSSPRRSPSVVKVRGESDSCYKMLDGSGFVIATNKVMTNAHVIAGAETFSVDVDGQNL